MAEDKTEVDTPTEIMWWVLGGLALAGAVRVWSTRLWPWLQDRADVAAADAEGVLVTIGGTDLSAVDLGGGGILAAALVAVAVLLRPTNRSSVDDGRTSSTS